MRRSLVTRCEWLIACLFVTSCTLWGSSAAAKEKGKEQKPAASDVETAGPEKPAAPHYTSVQPLSGGITLAALSNGLTVIVQESHIAPVATVRCFVKNTGSVNEGRYLGAGISHVLEHVVAGGSTTHRTEKEIEKIINGFGGATNAFTSQEMTVFFIDCPAKNAMAAVELLADSMQNVKFEPSEFDRELRVVRQELADDEAERGHVQSELLNQTIYRVSPAKLPVIGYLDVLNRTTNQAIIDFYRRRYVPNNQTFVVVGDVKTSEVLDHVAKQWTGTRQGFETDSALPEEPEQLTPRESVREMDGKTFDLSLAWPTIKLSDPDLYPLDLAAYILGEGESSRLVQKLKYDRQLVQSVSSASYTPDYAKGWFGIFASMQPTQWEEASKEILREVYRLRDELVSPEELEKAKKQKAAEVVFDKQTVQHAADSLGRGFLSSGDPLFDQRYAENIQKVTAQQLRDAARRYLAPERLNRVIVAPPGGLKKRSEAQAATSEGPVRLERLPNGVRVLLKRSSQLPLVTMQAYVLGGSLVETPKTAGISTVVAHMLDKGTAHHSGREIAEYFDSVGGQFGTSSGRNTLLASGTVLRDDFPKAFSLLAESFLEPSFPQEEFGMVKQWMLGAIARRADAPQDEALEVFYDNLPASSPYHLLQGGKTETINPLTIADLKRYHAKYFVPGNMIVAVFGDIDPEKALKLVQEKFGSLKAPASPVNVAFDRPNRIAATEARHKQTGKPTGMALFGYEAAGLFDKQEYAAMTVLGAVMGGYVYPGGWLHEELRGAGLVYSVHAMQVTGPAPGYFVIMAQTQPEKLAEVVSRIGKDVDRAKRGLIPEEEFLLAKQRVVGLHAQENTTIGEQAQQASLNELYGLGYDYEKTFSARIEAVTRDDALRVAQKHLGNHVLVTTSPEASIKTISADDQRR